MMATPLTEGYKRRSKQWFQGLEKIGKESDKRKMNQRNQGRKVGEAGKRMRVKSLGEAGQVKVRAPLVGLRLSPQTNKLRAQVLAHIRIPQCPHQQYKKVNNKILNTHMHINTHIVAEEKNKNNTNGKIIMMLKEREKKMHLHIHLFKELRR